MADGGGVGFGVPAWCGVSAVPAGVFAGDDAGFAAPGLPAAATVAGVTFGAAGLLAADPVPPAGVVVPPVDVRPMVSDFSDEAGPAVPDEAGDDELVVTVLREPGPGVTVL
ncbi:hypothetical protein Ait01nite_053330 [Actinoplanes italicus]|nr:hypothetical protein Ait01nite_053330 [Actinoplanes italicus]